MKWVDARASLPVHPTLQYTTRELSQIKFWVLHHVGSGITPDPTPYQTALYHIKHNEWPGIGYHWVITRNGTLHLTNSMKMVSYHIAGRNEECVGILLNGNFLSGRQPTPQQIVTLSHLLTYLEIKYPGRTVLGHSQLALPSYPTTCPGDLAL